MMPDYDFSPQGWQCPICKRVYSPSTPMCWYCVPQQATITTTGTGVTPKKPTSTGGDLLNMFHDDITFCPDSQCPNLDCMRNQKNIILKHLPHSYSVEIPKDCPLKKHGKGGDEGEV